MDYKRANQDAYDKHAQKFEDATKNYIQNYILNDAELFIAKLKGERVLDLGSGPGRDSVFLKERGLNPLCFDISPEMIKLCEQKGLDSMIGDLENLPFENETFDGIWAHTSLLHMPKANMPAVLKKISQILKPDGMFYCGMKEGNFEGFIESDKYEESKRFFSLYGDMELRVLMVMNFNILHTSRIPLGEATFLNYLCRKI